MATMYDIYHSELMRQRFSARSFSVLSFAALKFRMTCWTSDTAGSPETTRYGRCFLLAAKQPATMIHMSIFRRSLVVFCRFCFLLPQLLSNSFSLRHYFNGLWWRLSSSVRHITSSLRGFRRDVATRWQSETGDKTTLWPLLLCLSDCWYLDLFCYVSR